MLKLTLECDGHGLESPVRMSTDAAALAVAGELRRRSVIQEQERAQAISRFGIRQHRADWESVSHPVAFFGSADLKQ
jgi:hypothetical protein